jgi:predicted permease
MPNIPGLRRVFRLATHRADVAGEVDAELAFHFEMAVADLVRRGLAPDAARAEAARRFGNVEATRRRLRDMDARRDRARRMGEWLDSFGRDLRVAARALRRQPGFALAAALTIALGVGANTAIFSVMNAVLLRTLPVRDPRSLVLVGTVGSAGRAGAPPYPVFERLRDGTRAFAGMAAFATDEMRIEVDGAPEQVMSQIASGDYFTLLGVRPALGRLLSMDDEGRDVAVLGDRYWRRRFGGDPRVVGRTFALGGRTFIVVGVTPPAFGGLEPGRPVDVTLPITVAGDLLRDPEARWFQVVARLAPGASPRRATAEGTAALRSLARTDRVELRPAAHGADTLRSRFAEPLYALAGLVALVMLIAAVNITNLLLARGTARRREYAVRLAAGAGRGRLVRQLLTETLLLYALGAGPALLLAEWGVRLLSRTFAEGRRAITLDAGVDWRVLAFAAATTLVAGLLSGLVPAWAAARTDPQRAIQEAQARASEPRASGALGRSLVAAQVALSLVLLVAAAAFVQTLRNLRAVDVGFRAEGVLTMSVEPSGAAARVRGAALWGQLLDDVRAIPGVRSASLSNFTPLSGRDTRSTVQRAGGEVPAAADRAVHVDLASDGYFETFGVSLLRGRSLARSDASADVAVISEAAARAFFPGRDPVGQPLALGDDAASAVSYRIVGVVRDSKHQSVRDAAPPFAFLPVRRDGPASRRLTLSVASPLPDETLLRSVRRAVAGVDAGALVSEVITARQQVDTVLLTERLLSGLAAVFGGLALVLASVGLYGVLSYRVGRQRRAIGIRLALGASPGAIAAGVLRQTGAVLAVGLLAGLPLAVLAARAADAMLWGVRAGDVATYLAAAALLCLGAAAGAGMPAWRASTVPPSDALRPD